MSTAFILISALTGTLGVGLTLGGILSLVLPNAEETARFAERGQQTRKSTWLATLLASRDAYVQNRAEMYDGDRLREQWQGNSAGRKMLCWGLLFLGIAFAAGFGPHLLRFSR
jgi:hypothetical protein